MKRFLEDTKARIVQWLGQRASRDINFVDRLCRRLLDRVLRLPPENDFLRDEWVDSDVGFDPDELDRYQRGETE
ncbi:MAG: hypothetical protein HKN37_02120 [Rhodothermales bacterium]|nr:hypothetical protein [Rhodothermales bacterium]